MKKSMVAVITSTSITGMLLVGCDSSGSSKLEQSYHPKPPETSQNQSQTKIEKTILAIDKPKPQQIFQAGENIPVSGSIRRAFSDSIVNVWLFQISSIEDNTRRTFITKMVFPISADGSFKGNFQVPKPPFRGWDGGEFVMVFEVPGKPNTSFSESQVVYLSIPTVKSSQ